MRIAALLLVGLLTNGCGAVAAIGGVAVIGDAVANAFAIAQRREARKAQDAQTAEIKALREEIERLRADRKGEKPSL